jgi:pyruvate/2-oxoglutarate dehydrogenase complex dihydrolipoamide dehydrogenase (E3) component
MKMPSAFIPSCLPHEPALLDDEYNRALISQAHPTDHKNPSPKSIYHLVIIGGGAAGLIAARTAAKLGAKVALIERAFLGGGHLNVGCVPSKTLIRAARVCSDIQSAEKFGIRGNFKLDEFQPDFGNVMERIRKVRARVARFDSAAVLQEEGVDIFFGNASFASEQTVQVDNTTLRFKKALIATGARPNCPDIPGLSESGYLTNETVFNLTALPKRLLVIGGGPLGCEFAQSFQRLGSQVTIVQSKALFLPNEERDAAQLLSQSFAQDGMHIRLNTQVVAVRMVNGERHVELKEDSHVNVIVVDQILAGVGRKPNVEGLGLELAHVRYDIEKGITVNDFLRTSNPRIYAAGDVCSDYKFTHMADAAARIAVENALFFRRKRFSSLVIPWCTYTDPEVAHVGVYVRDARANGLPIKSYTIPMHQVDRAVADGEEDGFVKIHVREGTDKILGATIVARHAGEMINEVSLAMVYGLGLRDVERVIHSYPTQVEAIHKAGCAYTLSRLSPFIERILRFWFRVTG